MRSFLDIDLNTLTIDRTELEGEAIARSGRYLIAKTLLDSGKATVNPLSPENPLMFSAGPFAGTNFSNANRTSVGCKSPLTGGIKEANTGGTFGFALGQLHLAGLTLHGACEDWTIIHVAKDASIRFDSADGYLGMGNFETAAKLHQHYGKKISLALCGPVGEYHGLLAGIAFSDVDLRPSRLAARGAVGAVMGSKKIKAIVIELHKMPKLHDRKKFMGSVKQYNSLLDEQDPVHTMRNLGTAFMADVQNHMGGIPVRNFSAGQLVNTEEGTMTMGGEFIRQQNLERGGETTHACMPGCTIECSNVYVDADGKEIASPIEYETLGLMGTNCGLDNPDDLAHMNFIANDLGIDTIETGAMIGVLMEAGLGEFGDVDFMRSTLEEIAKGTDNGRLWAGGTAHVGAHYKVARVPVIKRQAISAYDPRVVEVTGITMMVTAQGADHTAGNVPTMDCTDKTMEEMVAASVEAQVLTAAADSLGLCMFGRSVTNTRIDFVMSAINQALGTELTPSFFTELGSDVLKLEDQFNAAAGFTVEDDELPSFFYDEPVAPTNKVARIHGTDVRQYLPH